jgi:hypothetical protein
MSRCHYYKQERLDRPGKPSVRLHWLNGSEWRGLLLVIGLHEFGLRIGKRAANG